MMKSVTVTLATAHTLYHLLDLAAAIDPGFKALATSRELSIQSDPANTGKVYFGDGLTADPSTTQRCGYVLVASGTAFHRDILNSVPFTEWYAMADTASQKVNILVAKE